MQDHGIYTANRQINERTMSYETVMPKKEKNSKEKVKKYLLLIEQIKECEKKLEELKAEKTKLGEEIINTPELREIVEKLTDDNTHSKTK